MRTTVTLAEDVVAALDEHRRDRSIGLSDAVNDLLRAGLAASAASTAFVQTTHDLGRSIEVTSIGDALETLAGPASE